MQDPYRTNVLAGAPGKKPAKGGGVTADFAGIHGIACTWPRRASNRLSDMRLTNVPGAPGAAPNEDILEFPVRICGKRPGSRHRVNAPGAWQSPIPTWTCPGSVGALALTLHVAGEMFRR